jgi:hypothetical protein
MVLDHVMSGLKQPIRTVFIGKVFTSLNEMKEMPIIPYDAALWVIENPAKAKTSKSKTQGFDSERKTPRDSQQKAETSKTGFQDRKWLSQQDFDYQN